MLRGSTSRRPARIVTMAEFDDLAARPAGTVPCGRRGWPQRAVAGQRRPSASVRQFIELAVNIRNTSRRSGRPSVSISATSASDTLFVGGLDHGVDEVEVDDLPVRRP